MSEIEKMIAGEWYDANFDQELLELRLEAEQLCFKFNQSPPSSSTQKEILKKILIDYDESINVLASVYFDYIQKTKLGKGTFVNHGCYFMDGGTITIGENVFIGPYCGFYTATHPLDYKRRNQGLEKALPIVIGDNCWLGANVSIMPGVTIGDGCVIAAGSVVTKDIPSNTLVAGVPAIAKKTINQGQ